MGVGFGHTFYFDEETVEAWAIKPAWYDWDDLPDEDPDLCCHYQSEALFELNQALQGELTLSLFGVDVAIPAKMESTYSGDDYCIILDGDRDTIARAIGKKLSDSLPDPLWDVLVGSLNPSQASGDAWETFLDSLAEKLTITQIRQSYEQAIKAFALEHGFHYRKRIRGWCSTSYEGQFIQAKAA